MASRERQSTSSKRAIHSRNRVSRTLTTRKGDSTRNRRRTRPILAKANHLSTRVGRNRRRSRSRGDPRRSPFLTSSNVNGIHVNFKRVARLTSTHPRPLSPSTTKASNSRTLVCLVTSYLLVKVEAPPNPSTIFLVVVNGRVGKRASSNRNRGSGRRCLPPQPVAIVRKSTTTGRRRRQQCGGSSDHTNVQLRRSGNKRSRQ